MKPRHLAPLGLALAAALASGCHSPRPTLAPLVSRATHPVSYHTEVSAEGRGITSDILANKPTAERELEEGGPFVDVHCRIVRMSADSAERLIGWRHVRGEAWTVRRQDVLARLNSAEVADEIESASEYRLTLHEGEQGDVTVANQLAFIRSFSVEYGADSAIGDPKVDVVTDGLYLTARGELAPEGTVALDFSLLLAELQRPIPQLEVSVPGAHTPVTIQRPITSVQELTAEIELGPDDCVVVATHAVGPHGGGPEDLLFVFLTARGALEG